MRLSELLVNPPMDCKITGLQNDSRKIKRGDLFLAYKGNANDGRMHIEKAVKSGAVAVIYDPVDLPCALPENIPCIPMHNLASKLATLACDFYQNQKAGIDITGVTGTNGKTTVAFQLAQAHAILGQKSTYIGTLGQGPVQALSALENTTPDALCLQQLLHEYRTHSIKQVCMEVSSHALELGRVDGIAFNQAIFTNLTQDHLDFHKTMESYGTAKAKLFAKPNLQWAILNRDDPGISIMRNPIKKPVRILTYGLHDDANVRAVSWNMDLKGTDIQIQSDFGNHNIHINAFGKFNIYNALAIFSSLAAHGYDPAMAASVMSQLSAAPGRMEVVSQKPCVIVDYAHTPDALENVLTTLQVMKNRDLWVVFGCGGDRDKTKRPLMGKAASNYADRIVITSDNPRSEDPNAIIEDVVSGIQSTHQVNTIVDREEAIRYAIEHADEKDIILIAGKGHEAYQQIGSVKRPFSDQEVVRKTIQ